MRKNRQTPDQNTIDLRNNAESGETETRNEAPGARPAVTTGLLERPAPPSGAAPYGGAGADFPEPAPTHRLSILRLLAAVLVVAGGLAYGAVRVTGALTGTSAAVAAPRSWAAAYVDTTLTPYYQFQDPAQNPLPRVVLGFVVADPTSGCSPSWGGAYTLAQASNALALDRRIAQYRSEGGEPIVSFGGQAHEDLALACTSEPALRGAYKSVLDRYGARTVDFDIEGAALYNSASIARRDTALAQIAAASAKSGKPLSVWVTLPVAPTGLTGADVAVVSSMIRAGVPLAGVNAMTMDFGRPVADMLTASEDALDRIHGQLGDVYRAAGTQLSSVGVWERMGATAMIGVNDSPGETFSVADASGLVAFANSHHMARLSMWSVNRDQQCGAASFGDTGVHSLTCSGVQQSPTEFSQLLGKFKASPLTLGADAVPVPSANPSNSPYPAWSPSPMYVAGYRVERNGYIYQAKWDNQGVDPLSIAGATGPVPWELLGPVLPTDKAPTTTTLPPNTYPQWSPTTSYAAGTVVLFDGLPYAARWQTMAVSPAASAIDGNASPWLPLFTVPGEPGSGG